MQIRRRIRSTKSGTSCNCCNYDTVLLKMASLCQSTSSTVSCANANASYINRAHSFPWPTKFWAKLWVVKFVFFVIEITADFWLPAKVHNNMIWRKNSLTLLVQLLDAEFNWFCSGNCGLYISSTSWSITLLRQCKLQVSSYLDGRWTIWICDDEVKRSSHIVDKPTVVIIIALLDERQ